MARDRHEAAPASSALVQEGGLLASASRNSNTGTSRVLVGKQRTKVSNASQDGANEPRTKTRLYAKLSNSGQLGAKPGLLIRNARVACSSHAGGTKLITVAILERISKILLMQDNPGICPNGTFFAGRKLGQPLIG